MDNKVALERVKRFGRQSLWLAALNVGVIASVFLWCLVGYWQYAGGDPIGAAFAYGLYALPAILLGILVFLPVSGAGAVMALRGIIGSRRLSGRPAFRFSVIGLIFHSMPLILIGGYILLVVILSVFG